MSASRTEQGAGIRRHVPASKHPEGVLDEELLTRRCLQMASDLGFARAGVASVEPFGEELEVLKRFLAEGREGEMTYLGNRNVLGQLLRRDPKEIFPAARSAICVALPYALVSSPSSTAGLGARIANYAQYADYHVVLRDLLLELADRVCEAAGRVVHSRVCVDSAPLLERDLAVRAGFVFLGKNTLAISPGAGSAFLLGELLLDLSLSTTDQVLFGCGSCTACLTACPTEAFRGPFELDPRRCISYLTIEAKADIPLDLRARMGAHVFGCDECQTVCPYNQSRKLPVAPESFPRLERLRCPDLVELLELSTGDYKRLVKGTPLRRISRDQLARNAAVALGNSGKETAVEPLFRVASGTRGTALRTHATWALGHLGYRFDLAAAREKLRLLARSSQPAVAQEAQRWRGAGSGSAPD